MKKLDGLISIMQETMNILSKEGNDFSWSSWIGQGDAITEVDRIIKELEAGSQPSVIVPFAPTGPIQEVSISSRWEGELIELAKGFDKETEKVMGES